MTIVATADVGRFKYDPTSQLTLTGGATVSAAVTLLVCGRPECEDLTEYELESINLSDPYTAKNESFDLSAYCERSCNDCPSWFVRAGTGSASGSGGYAVTASSLAISFAAGLGGGTTATTSANCCPGISPPSVFETDDPNPGASGSLALGVAASFGFEATSDGQLLVLAAGMSKSGAPCESIGASATWAVTSLLSDTYEDDECGTQNYVGPNPVSIPAGNYGFSGTASFQIQVGAAAPETCPWSQHENATGACYVNVVVRFIPSGSCLSDLDGDGDKDQADLGLLLGAYGTHGGIEPEPGYVLVADLNGDGVIDQADLGAFFADTGCD